MEGRGTQGPSRRWGRCGQSSVEYVLVLLAFLSMVLALGALWHAGRDGTLLGLAVDASSHRLGGPDWLGAFRDILLY